jgi:hypothetical protein
MWEVLGSNFFQYTTSSHWCLAPSRGVWCRDKDSHLYARGSHQIRSSGRLSILLIQGCRTLYQSLGRMPECLKSSHGNLPQNTFAINNRWSLSHSTIGCRLSVVQLSVTAIPVDLDRPLGLQYVEAPRISRLSAHDGGKVGSPMHQPPLPPGDTAGTHFY